jgi:ATP-dependent DNA helicase RecG
MALSRKKIAKSPPTRIDLPTSAKRLSALVREGEGPSLEFKRSTGELKEAMQTLCAFLNGGGGGTVLFGVRPDGRIEGQQVSDQTLRDVAQAGQRFEPPADLALQRIPIGPGREVLAVTVQTRPDTGPFVYDGRPYERVASTTRRMAQTKYDERLLDRAHATWRWEDEPAKGLTLKDLDRGEILRTRELAIQHNRISVDTGRDIGEILDRLGLRVGGVLTRASLMLYGNRSGREKGREFGLRDGLTDVAV